MRRSKATNSFFHDKAWTKQLRSAIFPKLYTVSIRTHNYLIHFAVFNNSSVYRENNLFQSIFSYWNPSIWFLYTYPRTGQRRANFALVGGRIGAVLSSREDICGIMSSSVFSNNSLFSLLLILFKIHINGCLKKGLGRLDFEGEDTIH